MPEFFPEMTPDLDDFTTGYLECAEFTDGAGFWDRGNDPCFEALTRASEPYGSVDLYCGDDSLIYGM
jgi:hypothetical protein